MLLRPGLPGLVGAVGAALLGFAILSIGHRATLRHVWVTLSREGISGGGETHRDPVFGWHEPVIVDAQSRFGFEGVVVRRPQDPGMGGAKAGSLFIPQAVLRQQSFGAALAGLAPASHPLRRRVGGAS